MFTFSCTFNTVFGFGALSEAGRQVRACGCSRPLIVCDAVIVKLGLLQKLTDALDREGLPYAVFDKVLPNPRRSGVEAAAELARREHADCFIALGGGSPIDTAKAANVLLTAPDGPELPLIAIPTTSGTGSDQSQGGMISDDATHKKISVNSRQPTVSICDPELTMTLPRTATLAGAVDALAHALESLTSTAANRYTDLICENAVTAVVRYLPVLLEDGSDRRAREEIMFAASSVGRAICIAVPHLGHAVGHEIGGAFDIVHGFSVVTAAPQMLNLLAPAIPERIRRIGALLGLQIPENAAPEEIGVLVRDGLTSLLRAWGVPNLRALGCDPGPLLARAPAILRDPMLAFSPVPPTEPLIRDILTHAFSF